MSDIFFGKFSELIVLKNISREKKSKPESENISRKKPYTKYGEKILIYSVVVLVLLGILSYLIF